MARGYGQLVDGHTVEVETHFGSTETYTADYVLVCTGSNPIEPEKFDIDNDKVLDYKSILDLTHIPKRLAIIGGGVNAIEYATTFACAGYTRNAAYQPQGLSHFPGSRNQRTSLRSRSKKGINIKTNVTDTGS
ncbi:MAG: FAD-dependent oxidoreductase [Fodinibius sp.]|nr:FAD-dependent oxidoreductase [Fodinibius sp.]